MAKIPFTLEAWLADRSQRVETRDGRSARIICTDAKADDGACVIALITDDGGEEAYQFFPDGRAFSSKSSIEDCADLFLITPEPELSEFEKALWEIMKSEGSPIGPMDKFTQDDKRVFHTYSNQLLNLARKELTCQGNIVLSIEDFEKRHMEAQEIGRKEALKDLPRWVDDGLQPGCGAINISGLCGFDFLRRNGKLLSVSAIEKLPGFKEDEK